MAYTAGLPITSKHRNQSGHLHCLLQAEYQQQMDDLLRDARVPMAEHAATCRLGEKVVPPASSMVLQFCSHL